MLSTTIFALLPIIVTILLGMLAAKLGHFDGHDSEKLVKLIMDYALPLNVFAGIWGTSRRIIINDIPLAGWLLASMVICYFIVAVAQAKILHTPSDVGALRALSVADPSVPFIGSAVLPLVFGESLSSIDIGISSLIINVVLLPFVFASLAPDEVGPGSRVSVVQRIVHALKKPLVVAALAGFVLSLAGVQMPDQLDSTFTVLGKAAGGVAMFATGIVLFVHTINFSKAIGLLVVAKNVVFPGLVWLIMIVVGAPADLQRIVIITLAIPTATMPTNLAIQYKIHEGEMASVQFWSTVLSFVTLSAAMMLVG